MCIYTLINLPGVWNDNSLGKSTVATPAKPQPIQCLILALAGTYENIHRNTHTQKKIEVILRIKLFRFIQHLKI